MYLLYIMRIFAKLSCFIYVANMMFYAGQSFSIIVGKASRHFFLIVFVDYLVITITKMNIENVLKVNLSYSYNDQINRNHIVNTNY